MRLDYTGKRFCIAGESPAGILITLTVLLKISSADRRSFRAGIQVREVSGNGLAGVAMLSWDANAREVPSENWAESAR